MLIGKGWVDEKVTFSKRTTYVTCAVLPVSILHVCMQLEEYVLWRLRDVPGQRTLSAFRQQPGSTTQAAERPLHISAALPPSPYGKFPTSAAEQSHTPAQNPDHATLLPPHEQSAESDAAHESHAQPSPRLGACQTQSAKALDFGDAHTACARVNMPEAELDPLSHTHDTSVLPYAAGMGQINHDKASQNHSVSASAVATSTGMVEEDWHREGAQQAQQVQQGQRAQQHGQHAQQAQHGQQAQQAQHATAQAVSSSAAPAASDDYRVAHERAAAARAACDVLRGPPKSSRDDPHFMDTYYKSSRLSFIGRWKARIEALTATMAAEAPLPNTVQQPSALLNAFKVERGACTHACSCKACVR